MLVKFLSHNFYYSTFQNNTYKHSQYTCILINIYLHTKFKKKQNKKKISYFNSDGSCEAFCCYMSYQVDVVVKVACQVVVHGLYGSAGILDKLSLGHFVLYCRATEVHRKHDQGETQHKHCVWKTKTKKWETWKTCIPAFTSMYLVQHVSCYCTQGIFCLDVLILPWSIFRKFKAGWIQNIIIYNKNCKQDVFVKHKCPR